MAARDILVAGVLLFTFALGFFIVSFFMGQALDSFTASPVINESKPAMTAFNKIPELTGQLDYVILCIFIGMVLGIIITAWFIGGNQVFTAIYFIIIIIVVILSMILANVWQEVTAMSVFLTTLSNFPITNHLILRLPWYIAIVGFIGMIAMFAKPYILGGGEEG